MTTTCGTEIPFGVSAAAGHFSSVAGTLAGFAFTGALLTINRGAVSTTPHLVHALVSFLCSFVGLVISAYEYSVVTGYAPPERDVGQGGLAISEGVLLGAPFGLSILLLMLGLLELVADQPEFSVARRIALGAVACAGPIMILAYFLGGASDVRNYRLFAHQGGSCNPSALEWWARVAFGVGVTIIGTALACRHRLRLGPWRRYRDLLPVGVLVLSVLTAVTQVVLGAALPRDRPAPDWVLMVFISATVLVCAGLALSALTIIGDEVSSSPNPMQ